LRGEGAALGYFSAFPMSSRKQTSIRFRGSMRELFREILSPLRGEGAAFGSGSYLGVVSMERRLDESGICRTYGAGLVYLGGGSTAMTLPWSLRRARFAQKVDRPHPGLLPEEKVAHIVAWCSMVCACLTGRRRITGTSYPGLHPGLSHCVLSARYQEWRGKPGKIVHFGAD